MVIIIYIIYLYISNYINDNYFHRSNLNGHFYTTEKKTEGGIYWSLNGFITLKEVIMMIRPKADSNRVEQI